MVSSDGVFCESFLLHSFACVHLARRRPMAVQRAHRNVISSSILNKLSLYWKSCSVFCYHVTFGASLRAMSSVLARWKLWQMPGREVNEDSFFLRHGILECLKLVCGGISVTQRRDTRVDITAYTIIFIPMCRVMSHSLNLTQFPPASLLFPYADECYIF